MLIINDITIENVIKSKRKTLRIEIDDNSRITLRVPLNTPDKTIANFINDNMNWLSSTLAKINKKSKFKRKYETGENFLFLGENYQLLLQEKASFVFRFDGNNFIIAAKFVRYAKSEFERFYKARARKIITTRVYDIAERLGITFNKLRITSAKSRWGSCNSRGNVNFSWRLIMAKPTVIDYVIIHEFCHLFELNHSPKFWSLVSQIMPDYEIHKQWLNENTQYMIL